MYVNVHADLYECEWMMHGQEVAGVDMCMYMQKCLCVQLYLYNVCEF